jgi:hypothetical protein
MTGIAVMASSDHFCESDKGERDGTAAETVDIDICKAAYQSAGAVLRRKEIMLFSLVWLSLCDK